MRVISESPIKEFCKAHPAATTAFQNWVKEAKRLDWRNWSQLKAVFGSADRVGTCVVFDVGGNKYRLIAWVQFSHEKEDGEWSRGKLFVRHVLTHREYDKGQWKDDCEG